MLQSTRGTPKSSRTSPYHATRDRGGPSRARHGRAACRRRGIGRRLSRGPGRASLRLKSRPRFRARRTFVVSHLSISRYFSMWIPGLGIAWRERMVRVSPERMSRMRASAVRIKGAVDCRPGAGTHSSRVDVFRGPAVGEACVLVPRRGCVMRGFLQPKAGLRPIPRRWNHHRDPV